MAVSYQLRKYYFKGVVFKVMMGLWDAGTEATPKEIHNYLKHEFLPVWIVNEDNWTYEREDGSTRELTNKEFIQYIERIQRWAAEYLNIYIHDPNEWNQVNYESTELNNLTEKL
jgi:hypothetical protein